MHKIEITDNELAPVDVYAVTGIAPGTRVQMQNLGLTPIRVYSGPLPPATDLYNSFDYHDWKQFEDVTLLIWTTSTNTVLVQEDPA